MIYIKLLVLALLLIGCKSHKELVSDIEYRDSIKVELVDSVHTSSNTNIEQEIKSDVVTIIEERITETVKDSTNNVITERVIDRTIQQGITNQLSNSIKVNGDSVKVSGENTDRVIDYRDNSSSIDKNNSEVGNIFMWLFLSLLIVFGVIVTIVVIKKNF